MSRFIPVENSHLCEGDMLQSSQYDVKLEEACAGAQFANRLVSYVDYVLIKGGSLLANEVGWRGMSGLILSLS